MIFEKVPEPFVSCKTLERLQEITNRICNSLAQMEFCILNSLQARRRKQQNGNITVQWGLGCAIAVLLLKQRKSEGCSLPAPTFYSKGTFLETQLQCSVFFLLIRLQIVGLWLALFECWVGETYHRRTVYPQVPGQPSPCLWFCTCSRAPASFTCLLPVVFPPSFHFVPPSHWFWEQPGYLISPTAFWSYKPQCFSH